VGLFERDVPAHPLEEAPEHVADSLDVDGITGAKLQERFGELLRIALVLEMLVSQA